MEPLIRVNDLYYTYQDGAGRDIPALKGINLAIQVGEFITIIGANGSGKSTLARHLNALLLPTNGEVYVNGISTRDPSRWKDLHRNIAMVFQHPESQAVATSIEEDVAFGPENLGIPREEIRRRVDRALEAVGLAGMQKRAPHHLSGGQKQRLALAGVLAMQPRCIVLDEATSMLDPSGRKGFREIIQRLHDQGVTIVMITQDMDEAIISDRVIVLSQGRVVADGAPRKVMVDSEFLRSIGLDLPAMTSLAQALHLRWPFFPGNLLSVDEIVHQAAQYLKASQVESLKHTSGVSSSIEYQSSNQPISPSANNLPGEPNFLEARGLWHTYMRGTSQEMAALRGVDFSLHPGEIVGVIGATGSGKSTLLQHLNGLLLPQSGTLRIGNDFLTSGNNNLRQIRQQVALLFQQPEDQLFERYIADDVAYGPINLGLSLDEVRQRVTRAMQAVGLPIEVFRDRSIYSISGGERRRAALAGVLALEPKVLVLDEATAGLDPSGRRQLFDFLQYWQSQGERSIVWASHSMEDIAQIARRITILAGGRVVLEGPPVQVFRQTEALTSYGLDVPQIIQVLHAFAQLGFNGNEVAFTIGEVIPVFEKLFANALIG